MKNTEVLNQKGRAALKRTRIFTAVLTYVAAALALACMIGIIASVLTLNFGKRSDRIVVILYALTGAFAGGAALFALSTYLCSKLMNLAAERELDYRERLDSEESFFVGDGTLLTFGEGGVTLHGEEKNARESIFVPYAETRYLSICTRRRPHEKGVWCVAIELPVKYLSKKKEEGQKEKVLVQADAKKRLYEVLNRRGLQLLGEDPNGNERNKKFKAKRKFFLPNRKKRRGALVPILFGAVLFGGAVPLGVFYAAVLGALSGAAGCVFLFRGIWSFLRAKAEFGIYEEGIFWRESSGRESMFLKWKDVERVSLKEKDGYPVLAFLCAYGSYSIPAIEGAYESITELKREKCVMENSTKN